MGWRLRKGVTEGWQGGDRGCSGGVILGSPPRRCTLDPRFRGDDEGAGWQEGGVGWQEGAATGGWGWRAVRRGRDYGRGVRRRGQPIGVGSRMRRRMLVWGTMT